MAPLFQSAESIYELMASGLGLQGVRVLGFRASPALNPEPCTSWLRAILTKTLTSDECQCGTPQIRPACLHTTSELQLGLPERSLGLGARA